MKVLLLGSGGREHALARAIAKSPKLTELITAPGNPGTALVGCNAEVNLTSPSDIRKLAEKVEADLVIVGPEAPLVAGAADELRAHGFPVFGPDKRAAQLEGSKAFAKTIMQAAQVQTADSVACKTLAEVRDALERFGSPYVVKQDGLAAGKGVVVTDDLALATKHGEACIEALDDPKNPAVVVEEFLDGPEASVFCLSDGKTVLALPPAQDFKRAYDNNEGSNTGGMGAYTPLPWAPDDLAERTASEIAQPVIDEMAKRGMAFVGLLYVGLALTSRGPRVVEFNVRFGDPETQSVLERIDSDLLEYFWAAATGSLGDMPKLEVNPKAVVNVVLAAPGYPESPRKGGVISGVEAAESVEGVHIIHAGTALAEDGTLRASGGRVLSVVARGADIPASRELAYQAMRQIHLDGGHFRSDIAVF